MYKLQHKALNQKDLLNISGINVKYYRDQGTYVYYTVRRGNEVFRGYLEKMYTVPMGHNPTGIMYGGYLYNTKLKSYPIPTLASKKKMMTNFVVNDNEQLGNENKQ